MFKTTFRKKIAKGKIINLKMIKRQVYLIGSNSLINILNLVEKRIQKNSDINQNIYSLQKRIFKR